MMTLDCAFHFLKTDLMNALGRSQIKSNFIWKFDNYSFNQQNNLSCQVRLMQETPIEIREPQKYHVPIVFLVDKSTAMSGPPIDALNKSLMYLKEICKELEIKTQVNVKATGQTLDMTVDICIIAFGGKGPNGDEPDIQILQPLVPANEMDYNTYTTPIVANGSTLMATGIETCLKEISRIKNAYSENHVVWNIPWFICMFKGEPTDDKEYYNSVINQLQNEIKDKHLSPYFLSLGGSWSNLNMLSDLFGLHLMNFMDDASDVSRYNEYFDYLINRICGRSKPFVDGNPKMPVTICEPQKYHLPIVFLVDKSEAMSGPPIGALNQSLMHLKEMCKVLKTKSLEIKDGFGKTKRLNGAIDICIIAFGGKGPNGDEPDIQILQPFAPANEINYDTSIKPLIANGSTTLSHAIEIGLKELFKITKLYAENDIFFNKPWFICMVKGKSNSDKSYFYSVGKSMKNEIKKGNLDPSCLSIGDGSNFVELMELFDLKKIHTLDDAIDVHGYNKYLDGLFNVISSQDQTQLTELSDDSKKKSNNVLSDLSEIPFTIRYPEKTHVPLMILVDKSESMSGPSIDALNESLIYLKEKCHGLKANDLVADICIIAFGGKGEGTDQDIQILQPFAPANEMSYDPINNPLIANGLTPQIHRAIDTGLNQLFKLEKEYLKDHITHTTPWMVCMVKGISNDDRFDDIPYNIPIEESLKIMADEKSIYLRGIGLGSECDYSCLNGIFRSENTLIIKDANDVSLYNKQFDDLIGTIYRQNNSSDTKNPEIQFTIRDPEKKHHPIVLLVDKSEAMCGQPIDSLNQSLMHFKETSNELNTDDCVADICIIAFGGKGLDDIDPDVQILQPFALANEMDYDTCKYPLIAKGAPYLPNAIDTGLNQIYRIKNAYYEKNVKFDTPWIICMLKGLSEERISNYSLKSHLKDIIQVKKVFPVCLYLAEESEDTCIQDFFGEEYSFRLLGGNHVHHYNVFFDYLIDKIRGLKGDQLRNLTNVDIVYCIDTTEKMRHSIEAIKDTAKTLHKDIAKKLYDDCNCRVQQLRIKVITFRDYSSNNDNAITQSKFFQLPDEVAEYEKFINEIKVSGGSDRPHSALEALHLAINSKWVRQNFKDDKRRHIIVLFTESSPHALDDVKYRKIASENLLYHNDTPKNMTGLFKEWDNMDEFAKRLVIVTPDDKPWDEIKKRFSPCLLSGDPMMNKDFDKQLLDFLTGKVKYH